MFCYKCGNQIRENQAFCDKCGAPQNKLNNVTESISNPLESQEESRSSILQFIRGIPFGLVFLAFLLPLFVVSCPQVGKDIASYSAYQSIDIVGSLSELLGQVGQFVADSDIEELQDSLFKFSIMCAVMLILTVAAFGLSFIKRVAAAVLGIAGLLDMIIVVVCLCGKSTNAVAVSPGAGFYLAVLLFIAGITMCFIAPTNEKELPSRVKIEIYVSVAVISVIIFVVGVVETDSTKTDTIVDSRNMTKYKTVTIGMQTWMAENLNYSVKGSSCPLNMLKLCKKYGVLYDVSNRRELDRACPQNFRVPYISDWEILLSTVGAKKECQSYGYEGEPDNACDYNVWKNAVKRLEKKGFGLQYGGEGYKDDLENNAHFIALGNRDNELIFDSKTGTASDDGGNGGQTGTYSLRCIKK
ncbi:MAG: hypothetical protein KIG97_02125 [Fibrobacter sp.]|uniref:FISUMP domain-containing protein n=1 Tax=Fibrobacter sp. TaxID=35828 RepID=UPI0025C56AE2|nr:FISUMP domain-containing protein [Fibrobacter sp.]MBS7271172.1 hypothetical protein [Fibrobacter sp.]